MIYDSKFRAAFEKATAKSGVDASQVKVFSVAIDRTWGDLSGYAFTGPTELVERAAKFTLAWHEKHLAGKWSYNRQRNISDRGVRKVEVATDQLEAAGLPTQHKGTFHMLEARAVSIDYYPCAD